MEESSDSDSPEEQDAEVDEELRSKVKVALGKGALFSEEVSRVTALSRFVRRKCFQIFFRIP